MLVDGGVGVPDCGAASLDISPATPAEIGNVFHSGFNSRDAFVIQRAPFPAIGDGVGVWTNFVRAIALQVCSFPEQHAHMRAEELVSGAGQEVTINRGDIDKSMRPVVNRVDVGERSCGVSEPGDLLYRVNRSYRIRSV